MGAGTVAAATSVFAVPAAITGTIAGLESELSKWKEVKKEWEDDAVLKMNLDLDKAGMYIASQKWCDKAGDEKAQCLQEFKELYEKHGSMDRIGKYFTKGFNW